MQTHMGKHKLAYTVPSSRVAGSEKALLLLLDNINDEIFDNTVICFEKGPFVDILKAQGHKVTILYRRSRKSLVGFYRLYRFLRQNDIELLHECSSKMDAICARLARVSTVERQNNSGMWFLRRISLIDRLISHIFINRIIAVSRSIEKMLVKKGIDADKICMIYNGVVVEDYDISVDVGTKKRELALDPKIPVVSVIGRLSEQKGHAVFLRAVHNITKSHSKKIQFLVVGQGPLEIQLKKLAFNLGIHESIQFCGFRKDMPEIYAISDIIVLPSLWEPLANVALESMAARKPIIATDVDGMSEAIVDNKTGILVPSGDHDALADAIIDLVNNPEKRENMARMGYEHVIRNFSTREMVAKTERLFLDCLSSKLK